MTNIMNVFLTCVFDDALPDEISMSVISLMNVLLDRSVVVTTHLLSSEIAATTRIISGIRRHRGHPLLLRAKYFLRAVFEKFSASGLFLLLFCTETSATNSDHNVTETKLSSAKITSKSSLDSDLFFVLFTVLGVHSSVQQQNKTVSVELQFADTPVKDVVGRLLLFEDINQIGFVRVLQNLTAYIELIKPPMDDQLVSGIPVNQCIANYQDLSVFLENLTTKTYAWRRRDWDASCLVDLCTALVHYYPHLIKVLLGSIRNVFLFAIKRCDVKLSAIESLARQLFKTLKKTEKFGLFSKAVVTELRHILRQHGNASSSLLHLLKVISEIHSVLTLRHL